MGTLDAITLSVLDIHTKRVESILGIDRRDREEHYKDPVSKLNIQTYYLEEFKIWDVIDDDSYLIAEGIPHYYCWEEDYGVKERLVYFNDQGELITLTRHEYDRGIDFAAIDRWLTDPSLGVNKLKQTVAKLKEDFKDLPWANQDLYGKKYRTKQLIGA